MRTEDCYRAFDGLGQHQIRGVPLSLWWYDHTRSCNWCLRDLMESSAPADDVVEPVPEIPSFIRDIQADIKTSYRRRRWWKIAAVAGILGLTVRIWYAAATTNQQWGATLLFLFGAMGPLLFAFVNAKWRSAPGRRVYKRLRGRMVSGVCRGLSQAYGINVWLLRLLMLAWLVYHHRSALLIYLALDFALPVHPEDRMLLLRFRISRWWKRMRGRGWPEGGDSEEGDDSSF